MIQTSAGANPNYLAKIIKLKGLRKHSNADRLQCVDIDFQTVITGLDAKDGDVYVFFPLESKLDFDFLAHTNSFRDKTLNSDPKAAGFFEINCRVKAMRLRGEKSMGYIVPINVVLEWSDYKYPLDIEAYIGLEFDTINDKKLVEKYMIPVKESRTKEGKNHKLNRLVDGQVRLHVDTENLRKNVHKIQPQDIIAISYKTHGTSWWVGHLKVKKKLSLATKVLKKLGVTVVDTEFDWVYGSRKVVNNANLEDPKAKNHVYDYDIWETIKDVVKEHVPKGYTLYGEALGYDKNGKYIQSPYDYGQDKGDMRLEIYRITITNDDGFCTELSHTEIGEFCAKTGLNQSTTFFQGKAYWVIADVPLDDPDWHGEFLRELEKKYNEKPCFMCKNHVPEEGIVLRKESLFQYEAYKLKSFSFLEAETAMLDAGVIDLETEN